MKKTIITLFLIFITIILVNGDAGALTGQCANCHTMHNSQDGSSVAVDINGDPTDVPNERLLKAGCISCHMAAAGEMKNNGFGPAVLHTGEPAGQGSGATNAGGDFYWVNAGSDSLGHNVIDLPGIIGPDTIIGLTPPGFDVTATPGALGDGQINGGNPTWATQLSCAGTYGCHGKHDNADKFAAMQNTHHNNTDGAISSPTAVGNSYRFLSGIKGYEDTDWQWTSSSTDHNEYKGVDSPASRQYDSGDTYADKSTISFLCAECHGEFHSDIASDSSGNSPWRRHPTDIALPVSGEYTGYSVYNIETPVARVTIAAPTDDMTDAVVMCLSCHRAHGSNQADLLRFNYASMTAGSGSGGCFNCHTEKN